MSATFTTILIQAEGKNATGISVPPEIVTALGQGKKPKVKVTVNGYTYLSTVAAYGDVFMLPLSQEHRAAAGVKAGDQIEVTLELDTAPRLVEVPPELAAALAVADLTAKFEALSYSVRKEYARQVTEAKAAETRERRIANIIEKVKGG